jgi:hypothetical protein
MGAVIAEVLLVLDLYALYLMVAHQLRERGVQSRLRERRR